MHGLQPTIRLASSKYFSRYLAYYFFSARLRANPSGQVFERIHPDPLGLRSRILRTAHFNRQRMGAGHEAPDCEQHSNRKTLRQCSWKNSWIGQSVRGLAAGFLAILFQKTISSPEL